MHRLWCPPVLHRAADYLWADGTEVDVTYPAPSPQLRLETGAHALLEIRVSDLAAQRCLSMHSL